MRRGAEGRGRRGTSGGVLHLHRKEGDCTRRSTCRERRTSWRPARESGVKRFIYCSSTEAMGPVKDPPADEDAPLNPQYEYGRSKARAEELVRGLRAGLDHPAAVRHLRAEQRGRRGVLFHHLVQGTLLQVHHRVRQELHPVRAREDVVQGFLRSLGPPCFHGTDIHHHPGQAVHLRGGVPGAGQHIPAAGATVEVAEGALAMLMMLPIEGFSAPHRSGELPLPSRDRQERDQRPGLQHRTGPPGPGLRTPVRSARRDGRDRGLVQGERLPLKQALNPLLPI